MIAWQGTGWQFQIQKYYPAAFTSYWSREHGWLEDSWLAPLFIV